MMSDKKFDYKKILIPLAFIFLCMLILFIIFMVNRDKIFTNLKETDFFNKVFGSTPKVIENHHVKYSEDDLFPAGEDIILDSSMNDFNDSPDLIYSEVPLKGCDNSDFDKHYDNIDNGVNGTADSYNEAGYDLYNSSESDGTINDDASDVKDEDFIETEGSPIGNNESVTQNIDSDSGDKVVTDNNISSGVSNVIKKDIIKDVPTSVLDLCFVIIEDDGTVIRRMVKRIVPKNDSPLTSAINLLLAGPVKDNKSEEGCRSLIPEGSKLLDAKVSNGVAYLNFNEEFEFTSFGVEGAIHQLEQVVYTATAFPTVNSVQFLIEGKKHEYLGSEGQWIGSPLSRANF